MAGTYTDIVDIVAPSSAVAGEAVPVTIKIKNIWTDYVYVAAIGIWDSEERFIDWLKEWIPAGATRSFSGSFIMPNRGVTIHAYTYFQAGDGNWYSDDEAEKDVALAEVFEGTISRKELEYDGARANIPAFNIPQGERGLVHIWGRNDMGTPQKLGIKWIVEDPDGYQVEEYVDWAFGYYQPGRDHEFIGGRFDLDKPGIYTIWVGLMMNYDDPEYVDTYSGRLCTVEAAVPEPSFRGFGIAEYQTVGG